MTKTLQKKFIVTAMIAVTVLLVLVLGVLNVMNAVSSANEADRLLHMLGFESFSDGSPEFNAAPPEGEEPPPQGEALPGREDAFGRDGLFTGKLTENDARAAVFFTVSFPADGSASADVSRLGDLSEEAAIALAQPLCDADSPSGQIGSYRYLREQLGRDTRYVFLDVSSRSAAVVRVGLLSLLLGIGAWGLMLGLVVLLSKRAIRPIAENMEKQRRFVTDAGHEIKTPLAIIQANAEAMELRTGENKYTKNIREQVGRLSGLMQDLLMLAKADETRTAETATVFSLTELVRAAVESFQAPMELRGLKPDCDLAAELPIRGDRTLITRLVSILLDNAVKYASEGSELTLRLTKADKWAVLTLQNQCEQLPDCAPDKLFDRFYRADEARTQKTGGYGIGLSAARAIAEAHRGSISAAYGAQTVTFTVKLPLR